MFVLYNKFRLLRWCMGSSISKFSPRETQREAPIVIYIPGKIPNCPSCVCALPLIPLIPLATSPPPLPPSPSLPFSYSLTSELAVRDHARRVLVRQFLLQGNAHWFSLFYFVCKLLWPYYFAVASLLTILSPPSPPAEASMHFGISLCYSRAYSCQQRSGGEGVERNKHMSLLASFVRPLLKCPLKIS